MDLDSDLGPGRSLFINTNTKQSLQFYFLRCKPNQTPPLASRDKVFASWRGITVFATGTKSNLDKRLTVKTFISSRANLDPGNVTIYKN
jgi:hypothetical protein